MKWFALALCVIVVIVASAQTNRTPADSIKDFKTWKRLTASPAYITDYVSLLCRKSQPDEIAHPHISNWIHVYVNSIGAKAAVSKAKKISFPVGSILVKTKFPRKQGSTIEMMTVMIKGTKGSRPKTGDWQFLVMNGNGTAILADTRLEHCFSCHKVKAKKDFAFLKYESMRPGIPNW